MIEIKESASGSFEHKFQLIVDGQAVIARSRFDLWGKASLAVDDLELGNR